MNNRDKTLYTLKYLLEYSDEKHPLSADAIISNLNELGIELNRKTVYRDMQAFKDAGFDVVSSSLGFYIKQRDFTVAEVRLLIDAVSSVGFITPRVTNSLIYKLESLLSIYEAEALESNVFINKDNKCDNEKVFSIIDTLNNAIKKKQMVKFIYKRNIIDVKNKKSYKEKTFRVSPYAMIWRDDHYYLVCNNPKYDNLINLRIDRIRNIDLLPESVRDISEVSIYKEELDVVDYSNRMFNMFVGEQGDVTLSCNIEILDAVRDRFGNSIVMKAAENNRFEITVNTTLSDGLVSWIMEFGEDIIVKSPDDFAMKVKNKAQSIANLYKI